MRTSFIVSLISLLFVFASEGKAQGGCICPEIYRPVCGDDGNDYSNECFAQCSGVAVLYDGTCLWKWEELPLQSPHPYPNNYDESWSIQPPEPAAFLRMYFSYIFTQADHDFLECYSDDGLLERRSGLHLDAWIGLKTGSAEIRFVTDDRIRRWGFKLEGYEYLAFPEKNPCEQKGGICIPVVPGSECEVGYYPEPDLPCSGLGAQCCLPYECIPEAEPTMPPYNCCEGLIPVSACLPGEPCPISLRYCVDCGNGSCDAHESEYNCPMDCHDYSCDDGSEILCDRLTPICEPGEILAYQQNCYICVDPYTCEPTEACGGKEKIECSERDQICWFQTGEESSGRCQPKISDLPVCLFVDTRSEGWYWQDTGELIKYAFCDQEMAACFLESGNKSQGWYLVGQSPNSESLIAWDICH